MTNSIKEKIKHVQEYVTTSCRKMRNDCISYVKQWSATSQPDWINDAIEPIVGYTQTKYQEVVEMVATRLDKDELIPLAAYQQKRHDEKMIDLQDQLRDAENEVEDIRSESKPLITFDDGKVVMLSFLLLLICASEASLTATSVISSVRSLWASVLAIFAFTTIYYVIPHINVAVFQRSQKKSVRIKWLSILALCNIFLYSVLTTLRYDGDPHFGTPIFSLIVVNLTLGAIATYITYKKKRLKPSPEARQERTEYEKMLKAAEARLEHVCTLIAEELEKHHNSQEDKVSALAAINRFNGQIEAHCNATIEECKKELTRRNGGVRPKWFDKSHERMSVKKVDLLSELNNNSHEK